MHDDDLSPDDLDTADGVWLAPETLRVTLGQPRHLPGRRVVWSGSDPLDGATTDPAAYVARAITAQQRANGF
ncbi:hypothetical protein [Micromonospora sp. NPDC005254]|uniref:hypothetical protein n=1 Tax=Micromonospora sp. NPDC005254 TaxID=3364229 RepID=UPI00367D8CFB